MTIKQLAHKLRHAADVLDDLVAAETQVRKYSADKAKAVKKDLKKKPHWTQTAAGRKKMSARSKAFWAAKKVEAA